MFVIQLYNLHTHNIIIRSTLSLWATIVLIFCINRRGPWGVHQVKWWIETKLLFLHNRLDSWIALLLLSSSENQILATQHFIHVLCVGVLKCLRLRSCSNFTIKLFDSSNELKAIFKLKLFPGCITINFNCFTECLDKFYLLLMLPILLWMTIIRDGNSSDKKEGEHHRIFVSTAKLQMHD